MIKDIRKESILAGVPGRIIRNVDMEKRNLPFYCRRKNYIEINYTNESITLKKTNMQITFKYGVITLKNNFA